MGTCETFNGTTEDAQIPSGTVISLERIKIVRPKGVPPFVTMEAEAIEVGARPVFLTVHCAYTEGMTMGDLADALGPTVKAAPLR